MKKETKRERFVRIANKRTNEVLYRLRVLGGCANRRMYEFTDKDKKMIFDAIEKEVERVKNLFVKKEDFQL